MSPQYHHGDLPNALRAAAAELIVERGLGAFSLREVARRAGVSHAAPAHHFGDTSGLLTALAIEGFDHLHAALVAAGADIDDPAERLVRMGRAYVEVAQRHPAHCAIVFRKDLVDEDDPRYGDGGARAFGALVAAVEAVRDRYAPDLDVADAALHCWATMQGLVELYPSMAAISEDHGATLPDLPELAERLTRLTLTGLIGR
ncbi:MAG TPA: TetR/AcrR family transcriptional regulator [Acidimicrobiales bacterium]|nr:TetR/AcrR family transcriptional regulator [Acidimicrobiales bacterium]